MNWKEKKRKEKKRKEKEKEREKEEEEEEEETNTAVLRIPVKSHRYPNMLQFRKILFSIINKL